MTTLLRSRALTLVFALGLAQGASAQLLIDPSGGATIAFANGNDDSSSQRSLDMTGTFFGSTYTDAYVNTNGFFSFSPYPGPFPGAFNVDLSSASTPGIYALWDDLVVDGSASVIENKLANTYYAVTWNNLVEYSFPLTSTTRHTFQAAWFGANATINSFGFRGGDIAYSYAGLGATFNRDSATVGIVGPSSLYTPLPDDSDGLITRTQAGDLPISSGFLLYRPNAEGSSYSASRVEIGSGYTRIAAGTLPVTAGTYSQATGLLVIDGFSDFGSPTLQVTDGATTSGLQALVVGDTAGKAGTLSISSGGAVTNTNGYIGENSGSNGQVHLDGIGTQWVNSADLYIGRAGTGELNATGGATVSSSVGYLGYNSGSTGAAWISGAGTRWTNNSDLYVGLEGHGYLTVDQGAQVTSVRAAIASNGPASSVTVTGANSTWTNTTDLIVGTLGAGSLSILNGGSVTNSISGSIADAAGTFSSATVDGTDANGVASRWINGGLLTVGKRGNGSLTISSGGTVTSLGSSTRGDALDGAGSLPDGGAGSIADGVGSFGTTTVSGVGSSWTNIGRLRVGYEGYGSLEISSGGTVTNTVGTLGLYSGSTGTATVDGAGSRWTSSSILNVGTNGRGVLRVQNGGVVTSAGGFIGRYSSGDGDASVSGFDSKWTLSSPLEVGYAGYGRLSVVDGGGVESHGLYIGSLAGAHGVVGVAGSGSTLTNDLYSVVGVYNGSDGTLAVEDGGAVTTDGIGIGFNTGSTGVVIVAGAGSQLTSTHAVTNGYITVGRQGEGYLSVGNGGTVTGIGSEVAAEFGSIGVVDVAGPGSHWTTSGFAAVGGGTHAGGTGSLNVHTGGLVEVGETLKLWNAGTLNVNGGTLRTHSLDHLTGTLNLNDGRLEVDGGTYTNPQGPQAFTVDGNTPTAQPTFVLSGGGSTENVGVTVVGSERAGNLLIEEASVFDTHGPAFLGGQVGSFGRVTVVGALSEWDIDGELRVGNGGLGVLNVINGGNVTSSGGRIGRHAGSQGSIATVRGAGSQLLSSDYLYVGDEASSATLSVSDGGSVSSTDGIIGAVSGSNGFVTITGIGSQWTNTDELYVGVAGGGSLHVRDGGSVSNANAYISTSSGAAAFALIADTGSKWTSSGSLYVGGSASANGGAGDLVVRTGGAVEVGATLKLWSSGTLTLNGGFVKAQHLDASAGALNWISGSLHTTGVTTLSSTLVVDGSSTYINDGSIAAPVIVASGGLIMGTGSFGDLDVAGGGTVSPGGATGTLTSEYTVWSGGGKYSWEINQLEAQGGMAGDAVGWDLWSLGDLDGDFSPGQFFEVELQSLNSANAQGALANWNPGQAQSWLIATASDSAAGLASVLNFTQVDATQFASFNNLAGGMFSLEARAAGLGSQVWLNFTPGAGLPGDYNSDGLVNAADYVVWRDNVGGPSGSLPNDPSNQPIGESQYSNWLQNFGSTGAGALASPSIQAPSPATVPLVLLGGVSLLSNGRARRALLPAA